MKKLFLLLSLALFAIGAKAQIVIHVNKAGLLSSTLKKKNLDPQLVTDLKITGKLDARDFFYMRDSMPVLSKLNIEKVDIKAFGDNAAKKIPDFAFFNNTTNTPKKSLTNIVFPNNLVSTGLCSFMDCENLSGELIIPKTVTDIGRSSFAGCTGLTGNLVLPNSVTRVRNAAFRNCTGLSGNLILSTALQYIEPYAFNDCNKLKGNLILPNSLIYIGGSAFGNCRGFTGNLILPDKLTSIEATTFWFCTGFNGYLKLPANLRSIGMSAFQGCTGLTGELSFPENLNSIDSHAFMSCYNITGKLVLPNSLYNIGSNAFESCYGLSGELIIPSSIKELNNDIFNSCYNLEKLVIPSSVEKVKENCFRSCYNLQSITFGRSIPVLFDESAFNGVNKSNCTLIVPFGAKYTYKYTPCYSDFINIVDNSLFVNFITSGGTGIPDAVVPANSLIQQPANPKKPGYSFGGWFQEGDTINFWNFENDLVTKNISLFAKWVYSPNVVHVDNAGSLSEKIKSLGLDPVKLNNIKVTGYIDSRDIYYMRDKMPSLSVIDMSKATIMAYGNSPANKLPDFSFHNQDLYEQKVYLTSIKLPLNINAIGNYALAFCSGLKDSLFIPMQVKEIGTEAFRDCYNLIGHFNLPNSLSTISYGAFVGCAKINGELKIPNSITEIKAAAFAATGISGDLIIPNSVKVIDVMAFANCYGLNGKLVIPSSVNSMLPLAFFQCPNFKKVVVGQKNPLSIDMLTFDGLNKSGCELIVPFGSKELYQNDDNWKEFNPINEAFLVTYNSTGGSAVNDTMLLEPGKLSKPSIPEKEGHTFASWYKDAGYLNEFIFAEDSVKSNIVLYAKWIPNTYTVSFNSNGGSNVADVSASYNTTVSEPKKPIRSNYKFKGWYKDPEMSFKPWNFQNDTVKSDMVLHAKWQIRFYDVRFVVTDTCSFIISAGCNSKISVPETPVRKGYVFNGWYKDSLYTRAWNFNADKVTKNVTLYAQWFAEAPTQKMEIDLSVSPNPATDFLKVSGGKVDEIIITNASGVTKMHLCYSGAENPVISISDLKEGWYIIKIKQASGEWKILKFKKE